MEKMIANTKKGYWFSLKSYIYVDFKENKILLYDTHTGHYIETNSKKNIALISELYEPKNLGVTFLGMQRFNDSEINEFVQSILDEIMGDIIDVEKNQEKPICLIPILNLQKDVDKLKKNKENYPLIGTNISSYLLELNLFINEKCDTGCQYCDSYYKQFLCCTTKQTNKELSISDIEAILKQIKYSGIGRINILGGDISKYSDITNLLKILSDFKDIVYVFFQYQNFNICDYFDDFKKEVIVNCPIDENHFKEIWSKVNAENTNLFFIIESDENYQEVERLIQRYKIEQYEFKPFYSGKNIDFFKNNIYLDKDDIFSKTLQIREIFRNQKLNSNFFGTLNILPDGTVKANMNKNRLGDIKEDKILDIIFKELIDNTAWRMVRQWEPCNNCIYQFICPAPSNYEIVINKNNLCSINS